MRFNFPFKRSFIGRLVLIALAVALMSKPGMEGLAKISLHDPLSTFQETSSTAPVLTDKRLQHILYGDRSGGGHLHGVGKPCKSEFPANWSAEKIKTIVTQTAANDNIAWRHENNGYDTATLRVENVSVRLVINPDKNEIVTAYPVGGKRNPCPAAANDND